MYELLRATTTVRTVDSAVRCTCVCVYVLHWVYEEKEGRGWVEIQAYYLLEVVETRTFPVALLTALAAAVDRVVRRVGEPWFDVLE